MKPTGLPPIIEAVASEVLSGVQKILDEKELATGTVTPAYIDKIFSSILDRLPMDSSTPEPCVERHQHQPRLHMLYSWCGRLHKLPETFVFPSVDTQLLGLYGGL
ncbi:hypothetical protein H310_15144, partial [Aphanomyces invadans]